MASRCLQISSPGMKDEEIAQDQDQQSMSSDSIQEEVIENIPVGQQALYDDSMSMNEYGEDDMMGFEEGESQLQDDVSME